MGSPNIEYEVRPIDIMGDSTDVIHFGCATRARRMVESFKSSGEDVAVVLERHDLRTDEYEVIALAGDPEALATGGWKLHPKWEPRPAVITPVKPARPKPATTSTLEFRYDDGGRAAAGYRGTAGDCVARAVAIASGRPYGEVYRALAEGRGAQRATTRTGKQSASARNGIHVGRKWFRDYMAQLGFTWHPTMQIGKGCTTHLRPGELPMTGRLIVAVSKHYTTLIDGVICDSHDPSRGGNRCVYGYWTLQGRA